jgi:hypothetical protein
MTPKSKNIKENIKHKIKITQISNNIHQQMLISSKNFKVMESVPSMKINNYTHL